jgi:GNAT superfamily N-acetyltransferase
MRSDELDAAVDVWREANIARGAPHGLERTAHVHAKLTAPDSQPFVALRAGVVGMALAEPGRFDDGAGELDPSLLHISMVFVHPAAQRTGIGGALLRHIIDVARTMGCQRVDVWTAEANGAARRLYEQVGMALTGRSEPGLRRMQVQYLMQLEREVT